MDRTTTAKFLIEIFFASTLLTNLMGCSSLEVFKKTNFFQAEKQTEYDEDEIKLQKWEKDLDSANYLIVTQEIPLYIQTKPSTQHWYAILFTLGKAKEGLEDWQGAVLTYREIIERSSERQMEFVALASYRIAYCEEVLMENERALAALSDAYKLKAYLPLEISLAEIPARIASVHSRLNQPQLADIYTAKAEKGMNKLKAIKRGADPEWVSQTLIRMGSLSLNQIDPVSFRQNLSTLARNQRYLLQAIEINHSKWSKEAQSILLSTYTNLWKFIENYKVGVSPDWESDVVAEAQTKSNFLSSYLESIEKLKSYRAPDESPNYTVSEPFFQQIGLLEVQAVSLLNTELLNRPWNQRQTLELNSTQDSKLNPQEQKGINFEADKRPEYIPTQLPKKKNPSR